MSKMNGGPNFAALDPNYVSTTPVSAKVQSDAETLLATAKLILRNKTPYFRPLVLSLVLRWAPELNTMVVSERGVLTIDPLWFVTLPPNMAAGALLHECLHLWQKHGSRRGMRHPMGWNCAADLSINPQVIEVGMELPEGVLFPQKFQMPDGLTADEYYRKLQEQAAEDGDGAGAAGDGDGAGAAGDGQGGEDGTGGEDGAGEASEGAGSGVPKGVTPKFGAGSCGSCATHKPTPDEKKADDADGRTEAQMQRAARAVSEQIREAAQSGKQQGRMPAGWKVFAEASLEPPKVNWREKLQHAVRRAVATRPGANTHRYDAPSRRQSGLGFGSGAAVLPRYRAIVPNVSVLVDTSGSMGRKEVTECLRETRGILKSVGADVQIIICDAQVHAVQRVSNVEQVVSMLAGGGGTDFNPAFEELSKSKPMPEIFIVLTDGFAGVPAKAPQGVHVIWALVGAHVSPKVAEYGDHVRVEFD